MQIIKLFDPWKSPLCTCPPKYTLNPYTGCQHKCIYCYASSYIPNFFKIRIKPNILSKVKKDIPYLDKKLHVSISNSSDPYPPIEKDYKITRQILKLFVENEIPFMIITKSNLVTRDIDIIKEGKSAVAISITSLSENFSKKFEPFAPLPKERIKAAIELAKKGIPLIIRIDPIIPNFNDKEIPEIIETLKDYASQFVISTLKPRPDGLKRLKKYINPEIFTEKIRGTYYLPYEKRKIIIQKARECADKYKIPISTCREGIKEFDNAETCDGSHLIKR